MNERTLHKLNHYLRNDNLTAKISTKIEITSLPVADVTNVKTGNEEKGGEGGGGRERATFLQYSTPASLLFRARSFSHIVELEPVV